MPEPGKTLQMVFAEQESNYLDAEGRRVEKERADREALRKKRDRAEHMARYNTSDLLRMRAEALGHNASDDGTLQAPRAAGERQKVNRDEIYTRGGLFPPPPTERQS